MTAPHQPPPETQPVCVSAVGHDEEMWMTLGVQHDYPAWCAAMDGFGAYLKDRGLDVRELHVATLDWLLEQRR